MQIDGLFFVNEQGSCDAPHFIGNSHKAFGFDGDDSRSGIGVNAQTDGFVFTETHVAAVVIKLDALPFLFSFEDYNVPNN